jgi:hypothetical protein
MSRRIPRILAVLVGTFLATVAVTSPANADPTASVSFTGATLVAKGAAVDLSFVYTCSPGGDFDQLNASVSQRVGGGRVTTSGGSARVVCDGIEHTDVVRVISQGVAFKKGSALANWQLTACDQFTCINATGAATVHIGSTRLTCASTRGPDQMDGRALPLSPHPDRRNEPVIRPSPTSWPQSPLCSSPSELTYLRGRQESIAIVAGLHIAVVILGVVDIAHTGATAFSILRSL